MFYWNLVYSFGVIVHYHCLVGASSSPHGKESPNYPFFPNTTHSESLWTKEKHQNAQFHILSFLVAIEAVHVLVFPNWQVASEEPCPCQQTS